MGYILFIPVKIKSAEGEEKDTISLAPLAVIPDFQRQGIGGELLRKGFKACQKIGYYSVIALGHPEYYPKLGFEPAEKWRIRDPFGAPSEAFMAPELERGALECMGGVAEYPDEFLAAIERYGLLG